MAARRQRHKAKPAAVNDGASMDVLHQLAFGGLALVLFLAPYFKGLFFAPEQSKALLAMVFVLGLTLAWRLGQNPPRPLAGIMEYMALALPLVYLAAVLVAVNKGLALDETVKYVLYFLTFWCVSRLMRHRQDVHNLLQVLYISAVGVALVGLGAATELVYIKDGFLNSRIYSTFQYPNALASLLGAAFLLGLHLWYSDGQVLGDAFEGGGPAPGTSALASALAPVKGYLYAGGNFLLLAVLWGTKSRGGLLVLALVFIFYLAGIGARRRVAVTLHTCYTAAAAYFSVHKFIALAVMGQYGQAWLWIAAALAVVWLGQLAWQQLSDVMASRWQQSQSQAKAVDSTLNKFFGLLVALGAVLGAIGAYVRADVWAQIANFGFLRNALERMYFVHDAISMIQDRLILGWGGGGWREAYRSYQNYFYNSNEAHSYYFQVGVETGLLGLAALLGLWLTFGYYVVRLCQRARREQDDSQPLVWLLAGCFLVIAGHAAIDFDLSLSALTMVLWAMLGLVNYLYQDQLQITATATAPAPGHKTSVAVAAVVVLALFIPAVLGVQAQSQAQKARFYMDQGQTAVGVKHLAKAVALQPWHPTHRDLLARVYLAQGKPDLALHQARRAVRLGSYDSQRRVLLADAYLANGEEQKGLEQVEKAVSLAPYVQKRYDDLAEKYLGLGLGVLLDGRYNEARAHLHRVAHLPGQIEGVMADVPEKYRQMWRDGPYLTASPTILFCVGAASYQLGDFAKAQTALEQALEQQETMSGQVWIWLALVADKQGRADQVPGLLQKAGDTGKITLAEAEETFDQMQTQRILAD